MDSKEKHERNLKILRLSRSGYSARQIAEATGLSQRHVQRIIVEMRRQHRERLERLPLEEEPSGFGRSRALEALESLRHSMDDMLDILKANEPDLFGALGEAMSKETFDIRYAEIEVALMLLPETPDPERG
jgi:hypothetical protein